MTVDTKKLRELAQAATQGPWEIWTSNSVRRITAHGQQDGGVLSAVSYGGHPDLHGKNRERDLDFIATANPQTVIALLDEIERLRGEVVKLGTSVPPEAIDAINMSAVHEALDLRAHLATVSAALNEACDGWETEIDQGDYPHGALAKERRATIDQLRKAGRQ